MHQNLKKFKKEEVVKVEVPSVKKDSLSKSDLLEKEVVEIQAGKNNLLYMIVHLERMKVEFGVSYEEMLTLLYLKELGVFRLRIYVLDKWISLTKFEESGIITQDYYHRSKTLFKLTDKGNTIIDAFMKYFNTPDAFLLDNRETDIDVASKMKSVLSKIYEE